MKVHVTLHDVSPAFEKEMEEALLLAARHRVRPALLVVPDFHGEAPLVADSPFANRLRALEEEGHEVFLHGFFHQAGMRGAKKAGGARGFFRQKVVSEGEAEFAELDENETEERVARGLEVLRRAKLSPVGFVPPAWSMSQSLTRVLAKAGLRFTEDHLRLYDTFHKTARPSLVLNFASRSPTRLFSTVGFARLARPIAGVTPLRVALHPKDMRFMLLRQETDRLLAWTGEHAVASNAFYPT